MNKKIISLLTSGLLVSSLMVGCSSTSSKYDDSNNKVEEKVDKVDNEEVRQKLSMLEALYVNHYNSLSKLEGTSKIELQNQLDSSITILNNGCNRASDNKSEFKSNTDAYKAFDNIEFALFELKEAKEYAIKYLDSENYDDYKEYQTKLQISLDSYNKYTAYKEKFGVDINVSINGYEDANKGDDNNFKEENTKENTGDKTTNNNAKDSMEVKNKTSKNESVDEKTQSKTTEKVTHKCFRCGKNATTYEGQWMCNDCYSEKIAHEEEDEEFVNTDDAMQDDGYFYCKGCGKQMTDNNGGTYACDDCLNNN